MARPHDVSWSDVGSWPSIGDDPQQVTCVGCRRRGTMNMIAHRARRLCWSCWGRLHAATTTSAAPAAAKPRAVPGRITGA
jgi:hypothetical protein